METSISHISSSSPSFSLVWRVFPFPPFTALLKHPPFIVVYTISLQHIHIINKAFFWFQQNSFKCYLCWNRAILPLGDRCQESLFRFCGEPSFYSSYYEHFFSSGRIIITKHINPSIMVFPCKNGCHKYLIHCSLCSSASLSSQSVVALVNW